MSTKDMTELRTLAVSGSHFEIGLQLGRFGAAITHRYLRDTPAWRGVMARREDDRLRQMRALAEQRFPQYWQELRGLADGLELSLEDVFLWNCRGDIWASAPDGCTTVQIPGETPIIAHNEDGDPGLRGHCAIADVRPAGGIGFRSFVYPASLPGHTFAVTDRGMVQAVNNIRAIGGGAGLPRMMLGRAVLDCDSLDAATELLKSEARAGAFHFSLARRGDRRILSIEFTHAHCSVLEIRNPACHANHLVHPVMSKERQTITQSSQARQDRGDDMVVANAAISAAGDALSVLRDRTDPLLTIYRTSPNDPDGENTLATALFVMGSDAVECKVFGRDNETPVTIFSVSGR